MEEGQANIKDKVIHDTIFSKDQYHSSFTNTPLKLA